MHGRTEDRSVRVIAARCARFNCGLFAVGLFGELYCDRLVASRTGQLLGIDRGIEFDDLAASGTFHFIEFLVIVEQIVIIVKELVVFYKELLYCAEILVELLAVIADVFYVFIDAGNLVCDFGAKINKCHKELALCAVLVESKAFAEALQICCFFGKCHVKTILS